MSHDTCVPPNLAFSRIQINLSLIFLILLQKSDLPTQREGCAPLWEWKEDTPWEGRWECWGPCTLWESDIWLWHPPVTPHGPNVPWLTLWGLVLLNMMVSLPSEGWMSCFWIFLVLCTLCSMKNICIEFVSDLCTVNPPIKFAVVPLYFFQMH